MFGAVWAQAEVPEVLRAIGADAVDAALPVATAATAFTSAGQLRDHELEAALRAIVRELVERRPICAAA